MCKLLFISNFKNVVTSESQFKALYSIMAVGNGDGLGVFSEKGMIKTDSPESLLIDKKYSFLFSEKIEVLKEGDFMQGQNLAIHSRTSTNGAGLAYAHPFKTNDSYFAHNGVVDILQNNFPLKTKNDSEFLAHYYETGIKNLENIIGYYAYVRYDLKNNSWNIGRDDTAQLFFAKISGYESFIITTRQDDIPKILKAINCEAEFIKSMPAYTQILVIGGEVVGYESLPRMKKERFKDSLYSRSIGNELGASVGRSHWLDEDDLDKEVTNEELEQAFEDGYNDGLKSFYDIEYYDSDDNNGYEILKCYDEGYDLALSELKKA